jgi:hypothetical protein
MRTTSRSTLSKKRTTRVEITRRTRKRRRRLRAMRYP